MFRRVEEFELTFAEWRKYYTKKGYFDEIPTQAELLRLWKAMCKEANGVVVVDDGNIPEIGLSDVIDEVEVLYDSAYEEVNNRKEENGKKG